MLDQEYILNTRVPFGLMIGFALRLLVVGSSTFGMSASGPDTNASEIRES